MDVPSAKFVILSFNNFLK